jgi:hypothetical protein
MLHYTVATFNIVLLLASVVMMQLYHDELQHQVTL